MLLSTWLQGQLRNHVVLKLNQCNLISPNARTIIIDFVNSLLLKRYCIKTKIIPEKKGLFFKKLIALKSLSIKDML